MPRLARYTQLIFGSSAAANQIAEFGSEAAGSPSTYSGSTITPTIVQTLSQYVSGWFAAVLGSYSPTIEDMNALFYLCTYQLSYILSLGIAEWDPGTTYYTNAIVQVSGVTYVSLTDNNLNNTPTTSLSNWKTNGLRGFRTVTTSGNVLSSDQFVRSNSTGGNITLTLPAISGIGVGFSLQIKDVGTGGNKTTVQGNGTDTIDGTVIYSSTLGSHDSISLYNNGTSWDVI